MSPSSSTTTAMHRARSTSPSFRTTPFTPTRQPGDAARTSAQVAYHNFPQTAAGEFGAGARTVPSAKGGATGKAGASVKRTQRDKVFTMSTRHVVSAPARRKDPKAKSARRREKGGQQKRQRAQFR